MADGSDNDDDDYMNDDIVKQCEAAAASLAKSGKKVETTLASASSARRVAIEKKHAKEVAEAKAVAKRMNPRARLEEGLSTALSEENVGFRLLSKMGFKPGSGIGKQHTGRADPVPLEFRHGRSGLGREVVQLRLKEERNAARERVIAMHRNQTAATEKERQEQFAEYQKRRNTEYRTKRDLFSARKACMELDIKLDIQKPFKLFYWPDSAVAVKEKSEEVKEVTSSEDEEEGTDIEELSPTEMLEEVSAYLRLQHIYCLWCGTVFEDSDDLSSNCPGPTAEFHDDI